MNDSIIELALWQVLIAYVFVAIILVILRTRNISRERILVIATLRMSFQLVIVGLLLTWVIENPHPFFTLLIILIMQGFAVYTVLSRFKGKLNRPLKQYILMAIPSGTLLTLAYFLFLVIGIEPWYDPQYFIPIAGMIIGNSMTGITLGVHTMVNRFTNETAQVRGALTLGASPKAASKPIVDEAFDAAIMPTINNMLGTGIIFLPGMMTGQILSGVLPSTAVLYQITILLGILGGVALTTYIFLRVGYRAFFNDQAQLQTMDINHW